VSLTRPKAILDVGSGLSVLVIDACLPFPPNVGRFVRTWNLLRRLAGCHKISLLCYGDPESEAAVAARAAGLLLHLVRPFPAPRGARLYEGYSPVFFRGTHIPSGGNTRGVTKIG